MREVPGARHPRLSAECHDKRHALSRDLREPLSHSQGVKRASLLLVLAFAIPAHAEERRTTLSLGGMVGVFERSSSYDTDYYYAQPEATFGPRVTLSWENAPLAYPDAPGYRFAGAIVPELVGGALVDDERAQGFIGAGLRAELKMAQREMGLLRVSARGGIYLAARGMVIGDERKPLGEFAIGEYICIGQTGRIGFEGGLLVGRADSMDTFEPNSTKIGGAALFYVGWQP